MVNQAAIILDNTKLFKLSITDGLTGLFLLRHFRNRLANEEISDARYISEVREYIEKLNELSTEYGKQQEEKKQKIGSANEGH